MLPCRLIVNAQSACYTVLHGAELRIDATTGCSDLLQPRLLDTVYVVDSYYRNCEYLSQLQPYL